jgi:GTP-binding protein EngB required for normal cell division
VVIEQPVVRPLEKEASLASSSLLGELDWAGSVVASSVGSESPLAARLLALRDRFQHERLQIAVLGQFKRGKSTFINALLGASVLPTSVVPLTSIPTFITWRDKPLVIVRFANRSEPEHFALTGVDEIRQTLARFVTEEANPKNRFGVERVDLFYPASILQGSTVLIDTPGVGSTFAHNTEAALQVIPECDAALFVMSADSPITEGELGYLRRLKSKIGPIFFVLNKFDYLSTDERRTMTDFVRSILLNEALIDQEAPIFGVSARLGLSAKETRNFDVLTRSGMVAIEEHIVGYLATEKLQSLDAAIRRKAADLVSQAAAETELCLQALEMPLERLEQKSNEFARALRSIEAQRLAIGDLLLGDRRRLVADLETQIQGLRDNALSQLTRVIDDFLSCEQDAWEQVIKSAVSGPLETIFSDAGQRLIDVFSTQVRTILADRKQRIDELVDNVRRTAADTFDVAFVSAGDADAFQLREEPYWLTERIASTLIPDFKSLIDQLLPASLRRRRRRSRVIDEINELIIRNAENLRWSIFRGVDETFRAAVGQMEERLLDAISATRGVIDDALSRRRDHSFANEDTVKELTRSMEVLNTVEKALLRSPSSS